MQRAILAVSPNLQFLEQIRSHLEEGGRYRVQGVTSGSDALALVKDSYFDLAILDAESSDVPFVPFTRDLVAAQPGLKLLVFPPQNNPHHPVLTGLVANGFLKKPFFTPEVSRAFSDIFSDKVEENPVEPQPITNLAELWMKRPEVGFNRVEQLLGSTTAQTGLLIARGMVIAASGAIDDSTIQQALNLLEKHKLERDSLELLRFITLENNENLLVYASQLIPEITLVLFYSPTTSIQLARQEVHQVKNELKEAYPTTGELRKELDISTEKTGAGGNSSDVTVVEERVAIEEPENSKLKSLEDEIGFEDLDTVLSSAELKNLDSILSEMPPPDPEQTDEVAKAEPAPFDDLDLSGWLPLPEDNPVTPDLMTAPDDSGLETNLQEATPSLPDEFREHSETISEKEPEAIEYFPIDNLDLLPAEEPAEESLPMPEASEAENPANDFDTIWEPDKLNPAISPEESSLLDQDLTENWETTPQNEEPSLEQTEGELSAAVEEKPDSAKDEVFNSWLDELGSTAASTNEPEQIVEEDYSAKPPPLPVFDLAMDETEDDTTLIDQNADETILPPEELDYSEIFSVSDQSETDATTAINSPEADNEWMLPTEIPSEFDNTSLSAEPGTSPLGIRNFRFQYSCLLIPRNPKLFLTGDINERLSFILPQLHLEYGWHLTGITIRPQYMLWSVSVPMDVCPIDFIQEIRRRTSTHLFSNFPNLASENNLSDFWAPGFLAVSGSTSPSFGSIYDFINLSRDNQKLDD